MNYFKFSFGLALMFLLISKVFGEMTSPSDCPPPTFSKTNYNELKVVNGTLPWAMGVRKKNFEIMRNTNEINLEKIQKYSECLHEAAKYEGNHNADK